MKRTLVSVVMWTAFQAAAQAPAPQHPAGIENAVPQGVIEGGNAYVYGAYLVGLVGFVGYALSLWLRRPQKGVS